MVTRRRGIALVDAVVAIVLLGVAISGVVALVGRALAAQREGEQVHTAALLADEQLNLVLARGPDDYARAFPTQGPCERPFDAYSYALEITSAAAAGGAAGGGGAGGSAAGGGGAYRVRVTIRWDDAGRSRAVVVETLLAPRTGPDPDPDRRPATAPERPL